MTKKKKRKTGNTAGKTMGWLRDDVHYPLVAKVERWNPFAHIRQDLFGFIDIVAVHPKKNGVLAVQSTHENFLKSHKKYEKKISDKIKDWLRAKNRLWLVGWGKAWKGDGSNRKVWAPQVFEVFINPLSGRLVFRVADITSEVN